MFSGGDASMELTMAAQEDSTPWDLPPPQNTTSPNLSPDSSLLHGRGYFSALGAIRRKPSRPDAPPTLSKSCSDKLSLKQSISLLSSLTSLLISPQNAYLATLTLPSSQHSDTACTRAFSSSGRLQPLKGRKWEGGYEFREFKVLVTEKEFAYGRRQKLRAEEKLVPSNIASASTPSFSETLIGGTLQGRKQFSVKGASSVCKRTMWKLALDIATVVSVPLVLQYLKGSSYREVKEGLLLEERRRIKKEVREEALKGWVRNEGGERWGLEDTQAEKGS
jgi:tRNA-specific adenosine deaminase 1